MDDAAKSPSKAAQAAAVLNNLKRERMSLLDQKQAHEFQRDQHQDAISAIHQRVLALTNQIQGFEQAQSFAEVSES